MLPLALVAALATSAAVQRAAAAVHLPEEAHLADDEWDAPPLDEGEGEPRIRIALWGGDALGDAGSGRSSTFAGGEAGWAFEHMDVSIAGSAYRRLAEASREWTPVALARLTQRFKMREGLEATFGFGFGAGRPKGWTGWYQLALGVRVPLAPLFVAGELAFERYDILRLGAGLGVAF